MKSSRSLCQRVVFRHLTAGFIPNRLLKDATAKWKTLLAKPIQEPGDVVVSIGYDLKPFLSEVTKSLESLAPTAKGLLDTWLDAKNYVLNSILNSYSDLGDSIRSPYPRSTFEDAIRFHIEVQIQDYLRSKIPTLEKALKVTWKIDKSKIDAIVRSASKRATPEEKAVLANDSDFNLSRSDLELKYSFLRRNVDKSIPRLLKKENLVFKFREWFTRLQGDLVGLSQSDPSLTQFEIHGVKVVVDDSTVTPKQQADYVKYLDVTYEKMKAKKVGRAWYGTIFIRCQECGGTNPYGASLGVGGSYPIRKDVVNVFSRPSKGIVELVAHELGHRYWFKSMSQGQRAKFENLIRVKNMGAKPKAPEDPISDKDLNGVSSRIYDVRDSLESVLQSLQKSRIRWFGDALKKFDEPFQKAAFEFNQNLLSAVQVPKAYYDDVGKLATSFFSDVSRFSNVIRNMDPDIRKEIHKYPDGTDWSVAWKEVRKNWLVEVRSQLKTLIDQAENLVSERVRTHNENLIKNYEESLRKWTERDEEIKSRSVAPVSSYGSNDPAEAFAEVFAFYVVGKDLDRDQIDSFKSVILREDRLASMATRVVNRVAFFRSIQDDDRTGKRL